MVLIFINHRPCGAALLVDGYFNADLAELEGHTQYEEIVVALSTAGLQDMSGHFLPRRKPWLRDVRTWIMLRGGR